MEAGEVLAVPHEVEQWERVAKAEAEGLEVVAVVKHSLRRAGALPPQAEGAADHCQCSGRRVLSGMLRSSRCQKSWLTSTRPHVWTKVWKNRLAAGCDYQTTRFSFQLASYCFDLDEDHDLGPGSYLGSDYLSTQSPPACTCAVLCDALMHGRLSVRWTALRRFAWDGSTVREETVQYTL